MTVQGPAARLAAVLFGEQGQRFRDAIRPVDVQGAEAARPFVEAAKLDFPTVIDAEDILGGYFGFKVIPNGIFLDAQGRIRLVKSGRFDVANADTVALLEELIAGRSEGAARAGEVKPEEARPGNAKGEAGDRSRAIPLLDQDLVANRFQLGTQHYRAGNLEAAFEEWSKALALDPENFIIRKQIWAIAHPERFYPEVDHDWQQEQLARERAAGRVLPGEEPCDPDRCRLPEA